MLFLHIGNHKEYIFSNGYYGECVKRVKNLKIENNFKFINYKDNILSYYKYFYLLVAPTLKDTLSYVNIEANFNKVPTIFTNIDGLIETSQKKFNCFIPYPPSPVNLADKIEYLIENEREYKSVRELSYKNVIKRFNSEKNAKKLIEIYEKCD